MAAVAAASNSNGGAVSSLDVERRALIHKTLMVTTLKAVSVGDAARLQKASQEPWLTHSNLATIYSVATAFKQTAIEEIVMAELRRRAKPTQESIDNDKQWDEIMMLGVAGDVDRLKELFTTMIEETQKEAKALVEKQKAAAGVGAAAAAPDDT